MGDSPFIENRARARIARTPCARVINVISHYLEPRIYSCPGVCILVYMFFIYFSFFFSLLLNAERVNARANIRGEKRHSRVSLSLSLRLIENPTRLSLISRFQLWLSARCTLVCMCVCAKSRFVALARL